VVLGVECAVDTTIIKLCPVGAIKPTLCFLAETKYFARGYVQNTPVQQLERHAKLRAAE
jgi:hypothetical protein